MYKLINLPDGGQSVLFVEKNAFIPFDPANTDYQAFKKEVLAGAELQDADGNVMTDASAYIATLP
jgi:hypothetical protein